MIVPSSAPVAIRVQSGEKEIEKGPVTVELALQWSDAFSESILCYTNIIRNKDGGTHMSGLRTALTSTLETRPTVSSPRNRTEGPSRPSTSPSGVSSA